MGEKESDCPQRRSGIDASHTLYAAIIMLAINTSSCCSRLIQWIVWDALTTRPGLGMGWVVSDSVCNLYSQA